MREILRRLIPLLLLARLMTGCGTAGPGATTVSGGNPAAPPAPPAEIPAALTYPSDISINVDTVSSGTAALVGARGQFSDEITFGSNLAQILNGQANDGLQPLPAFNIPVSPFLTEFDQTVPNPFNDGPTNLEVKIDFSQFDFDGDGKLDGTGCTCPVGCSPLKACPSEAPASQVQPIAYRVWFNGQQRMAGLFTAVPTPDNPGAGEYRMVVHTPAHNADPARDVYLGIAYDHRDPLAKTTEIFERGVLAGNSVDQPDTEFPSLHSDLSQTGADATAKKQLRLSADGFPPDFADVTATPANVQYIGQWREDNNFWSGTVATQNINIHNFSDQCAFISSGEASDAGNCLDLGIDVTGVAFTSFLTTDDVRLPGDFPASPTF